MPVSVARDPRFALHDQGPGHPESPERLRAVDAALAAAVRAGTLDLVEVPVREATPTELLRAHDPALLAQVMAARGRAVRFDPDTATSAGSVDAALLAAGASAELALGVARGALPPGIALGRPPGHHATRHRAMGFCLFNSVAVAAHALLDAGLARKVAIYDWDVHHGNGTQDVFEEDPRVLYLSTHQWPFYPGTGSARETGRGAGAGTTLNVPLPEGTGDAELLAVSRDVLAPAVRRFAPDFVLISAGFDPFEGDPLGGFAVTPAGFGQLAALWRDLAAEVAGGRIAAVLEGGYDVEGLGACVRAMLEAWSAPTRTPG